MYYYITRCINNAIIHEIDRNYGARILCRLLCAELEATASRGLLPPDSKALQDYLLAWIQSCIVYQRDYSLADIYKQSIREDFEEAIKSYFPFYDGDPALECMLDEESRSVFVRLFSECREIFGVDDQVTTDQNTFEGTDEKKVLRLMFGEEKRMTEDCLVEYFKNNFRTSEKIDDNHYLYNVAIGNRKIPVSLSSGDLRDIVEICVETIDELKKLYNNGYRYNNHVRSLKEHEIDILTEKNDEKYVSLWNDKFLTERLDSLVDRLSNLPISIKSCTSQVITQIKKAVICAYYGLVDEYEQYEYDATTKYAYLLILSVLRICAK